MAAAQDGDAEPYRKLLAEVTQWLRRYYARRLPPSMQDDAVQDTLLAIHERRHTYDPARPFGHWLAAIARHKWIDHLRAMRKAPTDLLDETVVASGDHGDAVTTLSTLDRLLSRLKPAQADVIRLVKLRGLTVHEAAIQAGQSPSLVKVNIHRGLRRLGSLVKDDNDEE
jgi:RNA polymerase sigma factor (sigma-70 family)